MLTRGIVESVIDSGHVKVRIPRLNKSSDAIGSTPSDELNTATVSAMPGLIPSLRHGDVVWIGFENDDLGSPVVIGILASAYKGTSFTDATLNTATVNVDVHLPLDTTIGNVTPSEISFLSGVTSNLQSQLDTLQAKIYEIPQYPRASDYEF